MFTVLAATPISKASKVIPRYVEAAFLDDHGLSFSASHPSPLDRMPFERNGVTKSEVLISLYPLEKEYQAKACSFVLSLRSGGPNGLA